MANCTMVQMLPSCKLVSSSWTDFITTVHKPQCLSYIIGNCFTRWVFALIKWHYILYSYKVPQYYMNFQYSYLKPGHIQATQWAATQKPSCSSKQLTHTKHFYKSFYFCPIPWMLAIYFQWHHNYSQNRTRKLGSRSTLPPQVLNISLQTWSETSKAYEMQLHEGRRGPNSDKCPCANIKDRPPLFTVFASQKSL
jgi:hypothetical protein